MREGGPASGVEVEVEGELAVAAVLGAYVLQCLAGSRICRECVHGLCGAIEFTDAAQTAHDRDRNAGGKSPAFGPWICGSRSGLHSLVTL